MKIFRSFTYGLWLDSVTQFRPVELFKKSEWGPYFYPI